MKIALVMLALIGVHGVQNFYRRRSLGSPTWGQPTPAPLVMKGGDPHLRALMRTISASESNVPRPYSVLYGGDYIDDLSQHPDRCLPIISEPNVGQCTTAAGRYQFITTTWLEMAERYHPASSGILFWKSYSFDPEAQDIVVYRWLEDSDVWGVNLKQLLKQGKLRKVLKILSPTWTSLGYGIETNQMTRYLPSIYTQMLREELSGQMT
jgi:muramidase (phage lysozyme)